VKQQASHQLLLRCYGLKLAKVVVSVLHMPPTSEAKVSVHTTLYIQPAKRNRLTQERSGNFRNENKLNAQFCIILLYFIYHIPSNMFWRAAIFREDTSLLLHKTLKRLKCAVRAIIKS
jgi:hypothetical protein